MCILSLFCLKKIFFSSYCLNLYKLIKLKLLLLIKNLIDILLNYKTKIKNKNTKII